MCPLVGSACLIDEVVARSSGHHPREGWTLTTEPRCSRAFHAHRPIRTRTPQTPPRSHGPLHPPDQEYGQVSDHADGRSVRVEEACTGKEWGMAGWNASQKEPVRNARHRAGPFRLADDGVPAIDFRVLCHAAHAPNAALRPAGATFDQRVSGVAHASLDLMAHQHLRRM